MPAFHANQRRRCRAVNAQGQSGGYHCNADGERERKCRFHARPLIAQALMMQSFHGWDPSRTMTSSALFLPATIHRRWATVTGLWGPHELSVFVLGGLAKCDEIRTSRESV
jgi:hypothetical protein